MKEQDAAKQKLRGVVRGVRVSGFVQQVKAVFHVVEASSCHALSWACVRHHQAVVMQAVAILSRIARKRGAQAVVRVAGCAVVPLQHDAGNAAVFL
jgi:hypothetical protein